MNSILLEVLILKSEGRYEEAVELIMNNKEEFGEEFREVVSHHEDKIK